MGAALLVMVVNLTAGRKRFAAVADEVRAIGVRAERLRDRAQSLVEEDSSAYQKVAEAMALPKAGDREREERRATIQDALRGAVAPPLATMRAACEVLLLAESLVNIGNPSAVSDVGTAAAAAGAGFVSARLNVEINLASVQDKEWCRAVEHELAALPDADALERRVLAATVSSIRGGA